MENLNKTYLGDGVYAEVDENNQLKIYTSDGIIEGPPIYLSMNEIDNLVRFAGIKEVI